MDKHFWVFMFILHLFSCNHTVSESVQVSEELLLQIYRTKQWFIVRGLTQGNTLFLKELQDCYLFQMPDSYNQMSCILLLRYYDLDKGNRIVLLSFSCRVFYRDGCCTDTIMVFKT